MGDDTVSTGKGDDIIVGIGGDNTLDGGAGDDTFTITAANSLDTSDTITGGTGTADVINLTNVAAATPDLDDQSGVEKVVIVDGADGADMTLAITYTAANTSDMTIDASALDAGEDFTLDLSDAEVDGDYTIITGDGVDTITVGDGVNTIQVAFGGQGADVINSFVSTNDIIDFTGTSDVAGTGITDGTFTASAVVVGGGAVAASTGFHFVTDAGWCYSSWSYCCERSSIPSRC